MKIIVSDQVFHLQGKHLSYVLGIDASGSLVHLHYGAHLEGPITFDMFDDSPPLELGSSTTLEHHEKPINLHITPLEISTYGKGDYREPTLHVETAEGYRSLHFRYISHALLENIEHPDIPQADKANTLCITLHDQDHDVKIELYYSLTEEDVLVRNMILINGRRDDLILDRMFSAQYDFKRSAFKLLKLDGAWLRERHTNQMPLTYGVFKIDSKKGVSSSDHNPFFALQETEASERFGDTYGFNLIYSGSFEALIEVSPHDLTRVVHGINSFDFKWRLKPNERFITPESISTYSPHGLAGMRDNLHRFTNQRIIKDPRERPILYNNWEATYFAFNTRKILKLARAAKRLGAECFCLDDGWFGARDDDSRSLGDWTEHPKKLKHGLPKLARKINRIGLKFGLWVEPEMVNEDSDLYRKHPEWAIRHPASEPARGRRQLMLDLSNEAVIDYLYDTLSTLFERVGVDYVKWDMNRNLSDVYSQTRPAVEQGKLAHLYVLGLYRLLGRLKSRFPKLLFESCASGGNRFDLGLHYYMSQAWTSDNTDAYARLTIQRGTALAYPLSCISNHINDDVAHQTLRQVPLESRYNVAAFGVLGLELDTTALSLFQKRVIRDQLKHYKVYRKLFQQGRLYDLSETDADQRLLVVNDTLDQAALGLFQGVFKPNPPYQHVRLVGLDPEKTYRITARKQAANLKTFGNLIRHALPIRLKAHGTLFNALAARYRFYEPDYTVTATGEHLMGKGLKLPYRFTGSGYHEDLRITPDFGSKLYMIEEVSHG